MTSTRVGGEMQAVPAGFWPVPVNHGDEYALLLQTKTTAIKAAYKSCAVSLSIGTTSTPLGCVLATVLTVAEDPQDPDQVLVVHIDAEEHSALESVLRLGKTTLFFFDELSRPIARADCAFDEPARTRVLALLDRCGTRYTGEWNDTCADVRDDLAAKYDPTMNASGKFTFTIEDVPLALNNFETIEIVALGDQESRSVRLEEQDEGYVLEQGAWHLMVDLFGAGIFHSPQVTENGIKRELSDILSFCEAGSCVVQAKAIAVLTTNPLRTTERRARNIRKQVDIGLSQVLGAIKNLEAGLPLTSKDGAAFTIPKNTAWLRHGIIVVSDLHHGVDWKEVATRLLEESTRMQVMIHVLDLHELRKLVAASETPIQFIARLIRRFQMMKARQTALLRIEFREPAVA
ncbi:MAG: hypothetical protein AB7O59_19840 [Pirellulales bacterium]